MTRACLVLVVLFVLLGAPLVSAQPSPPGGTPPFTLPGITVDEAVLAEVDDYLARNREEHGWPGLAAAMVADGEVVWSAGYGTTGSAGEPITAQTPFLLASVSTSITAVAVMRLVDAGAIALEDPVSTHLPQLAPGGDEVTVGDLMFQQSGLDTGDGLEVMVDEPDARLETNVARFGPVLRADAAFAYSNANYDALALLVERVSGMPFEDFLRAEVFGPLDMTATTDPETAHRAGLAEGHYHWAFAGFRPHTPPLPDGAVGSYRMFASAQDVGHALAMHVGGGEYDGRRVLEPQSLSVLHTGEPVSPDLDARYGGGLWVHPAQSEWMTGASAAYSFLEHDGSALAYRSYIWLMPELELGLVLLANANDWADESRLPQVGFNVRQIVLDEDLTPVTTRSEPLQRWGRQLMALAAVLQLGLALAAIRGVHRAWRGHPPGRRWRPVLVACIGVSLFTGYALVRLIPQVADAPLRVVVQAPDARIIVGVMVTGLALALLAGVAHVAGLRRVQQAPIWAGPQHDDGRTNR